MRVVASLLLAVPSQTPQGGQVVSYQGMGTVWLRLGARRRRERVEAGAVRVVESLSAVARLDPRLEEGRVVRFGGVDWEVMSQEPEGAAQVRLLMERRR